MISVILFTTIFCGVVAQPQVPSLPDQFSANVTVTITTFGTIQIPSILYFDYTNNCQRIDTTDGSSVTISLYDQQTEYDISTSPTFSCQTQPLNGPLYPMSVPPFAAYKGEDIVNDELVQIWSVDYPTASITYYIGNQTYENKTDLPTYVRVVILIDGGFGFSTTLQYDFESVIPEQPDTNLFDVSQYNCPNPVPPVVYDLSGYIKDATNKAPIAGATVTIEELGQSVVTDSTGTYLFSGLETNNYTINAQSNGYFDASSVIDLDNTINPGTSADLSLSPTVPAGTYRAVLTWGSVPRDLDSHVYVDAYGCHVWYRNRQCQGSYGTITLDTDATAGYGPETVTFVPSATFSGNFNYVVRIYTPGGSFINSGATVNLYTSSGLYGTYHITQDISPTASAWFLFSIAQSGITIQNIIS